METSMVQGRELGNGVYEVTDPRFTTQTPPLNTNAPENDSAGVRLLIAVSLVLLALLALFVVVKRRS